VVNWRLVYTRQAAKDSKKLKMSNLDKKARELLEILKHDPYQNPPRYEKLIGDLDRAYSRRINLQHRLVYEVLEDQKVVKIIRMWTHYE